MFPLKLIVRTELFSTKGFWSPLIALTTKIMIIIPNKTAPIKRMATIFANTFFIKSFIIIFENLIIQ